MKGKAADKGGWWGGEVTVSDNKELESEKRAFDFAVSIGLSKTGRGESGERRFLKSPLVKK